MLAPDRRSHRFVLLASLALGLLALARPGHAQQPTLEEELSRRVQAALAALDTDAQAAVSAAAAARDLAILHTPAQAPGPIVEAMEAWSFASLTARVPATARAPFVALWERHRGLAAALARVAGRFDDAQRVALLAEALASAHGDQLERYAELAAAVCVVLDAPQDYPGIGPTVPDPVGVFAAMVFADAERRITAHRLDALPAELLVHVIDTSLAPAGLREVALDRRRVDVGDLYESVPYVQTPLLAGEAAPAPEDLTLSSLAERGGTGELRAFYAAQMGQVFGYPVAVSAGLAGDSRFAAPVYLEPGRRGALWNFHAIAGNAGQPAGTAPDPRQGVAIELHELELTAALASDGTAAATRAWALARAAALLAGGDVRPPSDVPAWLDGPPLRRADAAGALELAEASLGASRGHAAAWRAWLDASLELARDEPAGPERVLTDLLGRLEDLGATFSVELALAAIAEEPGGWGGPEAYDWLIQRLRRDPHLEALARLRAGEAALAQGDEAAARQAWSQLVIRRLGEGPYAMAAFERLESLATRGADQAALTEFYAQAHRRLRPPRGLGPAGVRASAYVRVGERYERALREAGRTREADRLRRRLDRALE